MTETPKTAEEKAKQNTLLELFMQLEGKNKEHLEGRMIFEHDGRREEKGLFSVVINCPY